MASQLGRYEILAEIGRGSMGAVFQARDPKIDRVVAIKTISVAGVQSGALDQYRQRFFREAQAAGRLSHPGIVTVYDVDEDSSSETPFIVMEYVAGHSLDRLASGFPEGRVPAMTALDILKQVAEALDYAHGHGIVHRDVKPSNIIVTEEGRAKIADFGIAKLSVTDITVPGQVLGTPSYMAPEQLSGRAVDGRSDLFSLGVIAYWLFSGEKPFTGDSVTTITFQVAFVEPKPLTEVNPSLNADYQYVAARALAKEPEKRYQTGKEFAADIQDLGAGRPPRSRQAAAEKTQLDGAILVAPPAAPSAAKSDGWISRLQFLPGRLRRSLVVYPALGLLFLALVAAMLSMRSSPGIKGPRAMMQLVGQHPFKTAELWVWVDGDLRYHNAIAGLPRRRGAPGSYLGTLSMTIPVATGDHRIRVKVKAPENEVEQESTIEGQFPSQSNRTLRANISARGMDLDWQ
jgi:serine/threonine protein kinase